MVRCSPASGRTVLELDATSIVSLLQQVTGEGVLRHMVRRAPLLSGQEVPFCPPGVRKRLESRGSISIGSASRSGNSPACTLRRRVGNGGLKTVNWSTASAARKSATARFASTEIRNTLDPNGRNFPSD